MESRKTYPLSTGQRLIFLAQKFTVHKQLMNIPTSCFLNEPLDPPLLKAAVEEAVRRNDSFGLRITKQGKEVVQYFTEPALLSLETLDFRGRTPDEMARFFSADGAKKMKLYDSPLCRICVVTSPEGNGGVYVCNSHLIMDSWAVTMFYKDIFEIFYARKDGTPIPKPIPSYEALLQKEVAYRTSEKHEKDAEFWNNEMSGTPPIFTHINGRAVLEKQRRRKKDPNYRFGRTISLRTHASHVVRMIEKEDIDAMKAFCQEYRIPSLQVLFYLGVRMGFARMNEREKDISIFLISARRATMEEKFAGGTRALALPMRTIFEEDVGFLDAINILFEKQNTLFRHADFDTLELFAIQKRNYGIGPMEGVNGLYLSFQPVPLSLNNTVRASTMWYCHGSAATDISLTVMDGDGTGALRCYYEYHDHAISPETIGKFHDYVMDVIRKGIEKPGATVKELLDMPV